MKNKKKRMKAPHLFWIMVGLLFLAVALTYIIPAGEYAVDADGNILQDQFSFFAEQTPVSPGSMLMLILDGVKSSSDVIFTVLATGASISVLLASKAIDDVLNWSVKKLEGTGTTPLIVVLFILMTYVGGFAGSDALVAMVPIGVLFANRLKLDKIVALGLTMFPAMIGFGTGPTTAAIPQMIGGVEPYSGFLVRFSLMNLFMIIGLLYLLRYVKQIESDPSKSVIDNHSEDLAADVAVEVETTELNWRSIITLVIFIAQFVFIVYYGIFGEGSILNFMVAANLVSAALMGIASGMAMDEIGNTIAAGINAMGFIGYVIGLAGVFSLILQTGNIMDTIVYWSTKPLSVVGGTWANVGMMLIVAVLNFIIPSATSKAAILIPTIIPITSALGITGQAAVQAFMFGNGFTIMISPVLGWTLGSLETADVPFDRWLKWVTPILIIFTILSAVITYILTATGWAG